MLFNEIYDKYTALPIGLRLTVEKRSCTAFKYLSNLIRDNGIKNAIEIGTFYGRMALYLAAACEENGGTLYTININPKEMIVARDIALKCDIHNIEFITGDSLVVLPDLVSTIDYQYVFIDGMHNDHYAWNEFSITSQHINKECGVIIFDDIPAVKKSVYRAKADIVTIDIEGGRPTDVGIVPYGKFSYEGAHE